LPAWTTTRQANAAFLDAHLEGVVTPIVREGATHVYHQYTIRLAGATGAERDSFADRLRERGVRSEEHTSELQSRFDLVCRLLLDTPLAYLYALSLHDALPISARLDHHPAGQRRLPGRPPRGCGHPHRAGGRHARLPPVHDPPGRGDRRRAGLLRRSAPRAGR